MNQTRANKMAEVIKEEISDIIVSKLKDPRVGFTTVTSVETSKDLRYCKVSVSIMGTDEEQKETFKTLESASGFIRTELASRIRVRHVPEIKFVHDRAIEHHMHIDNLIRKIKEGDSNGEER